MNAVLVPVRSLVGAKKRLAHRLTVEEREGLALAMLADMIDSLRASSAVDRVFVVSADDVLLAHASTAGADILREESPNGLNAAVSSAARRLEEQGVTRLLTIPGDVPLLASADVDRIFAACTPEHPVILVPSGAGTGTNGLLVSPPTAIEPRFEGLSLTAHRDACAEAGIHPSVLRCESFELDIDTPDDLAELAASGADTRAAKLAADTHRPNVTRAVS
jgi:2-phospho-L-lactate guanylyltransferase